MHPHLQKIHHFYKKSPKNKLIVIAVVFVLILLLRMFINLLSDRARPLPAPEIAVATAKKQNVPVYLDGLGTVTPDIVVNVKTQINGILTHVYFNEGQYVKKGEVIAQIDDRPYQAQLLQYQGALIRDTALYKNALIDLHRYINLYKTHAVSQQTLETQKALVKQDEGAMQIDQGQINAAKTNIDFCKIIAPVSGRIGLNPINEGNVVQISDTTPIGVITTLSPVDVVFALPQDDISAVAHAFDNGANPLITEAYNRDQEKLIATGKLIALDSQINTGTGTLDFKSRFDNTNNVLFPNEFVNIKLLVKTLKDAIVIPTTAIQEGTDGPYVYRYNTNHTVTNIPVKTGIADGDDTVIKSGVTAKQQVVTEGADKLFDGEKVLVEK